MTILKICKLWWPACCVILATLTLSGCDFSSFSTQTSAQTRTFMSASSQSITYSISPRDVLLRTYYGGGLSGTLELYPDISLYGDGTYILGQNRQGKLSPEEVQSLLSMLLDTYGIIGFSRKTFVDVQDRNATFLQLTLNGKQQELVYGSFGLMRESQVEMDEYRRLGNALRAITESLHGPTHLYRGAETALLVRQTFSPDLTKDIPTWLLPDFSLEQAAAFECGLIPPDETSSNAETACLKYTIPSNVILLSAVQRQIIHDQLQGAQGTFIEQGIYYTVVLRPLLPDEHASKSLAMLGSAQDSYKRVPLLVEGTVPPVPTPTPEH